MGNKYSCTKSNISDHRDHAKIYPGLNKNLVPSMKNFTNLRYIEDISSFYELKDKLGQGNYGTVY